MALLLLAAAGVSGLVLGERAEAIAILAIVAVNAVIALVLEGRAERALAALDELEAPSAAVIRSGRRQIVDARDLVPGDQVLLQAGDRVPADLTLGSGDGLEIDEAVLTGESTPARKRTGGATDPTLSLGDRDGCLYSGTLVTRGSGQGTVTATGTSTVLGEIASRLAGRRRDPTPLQEQLANLTGRLGAAAVLVAVGSFVLSALVVRHLDLHEAFLTAVALAVAAVPEGLAAVTTVALALGVGRMAQQGAIVRRLPAVETLGTTDVLVIDKTGTVTENRMRAGSILTPDGARHDGPVIPARAHPTLEAALALCSEATLDPPTGDPTEQALLELVNDPATWRERCPRLAVAPFTSERRRMSTVNAIRGELHLLLKGAPETVLPRCNHAATDGRIVPMKERHRLRLTDQVQAAARRGGRVLAVASRTLREVPADPEQAEHDLVLVGLVVLRDPPRASAAASVRAARDAGISIVMATGDHPATATAIAGEIGLAVHDVRTGPDIRAHGSPDDPTSVSVLARVDPDQKYDLVSLLQQRRHVVAMTGDGVNDAPALRKADIGIALGRTGSDVAREAADMVVTDDDLATIVLAVQEGRTIHDNVRKVIDYLVASNLSEVLIVVASLMLAPGLGVPLFPLQLLWINLLTDGLPALALGVDPGHPDTMHRPPRDPRERMLDAPHLRRLARRAVVLSVGPLGVVLLAHHVLGMVTATARTLLFTSLVIAQIGYAWVVHRPVEATQRPTPNPWLVLAVVAALVLQYAVVSLPMLSLLFDTVALPTVAWLGTIAGGLLGPCLLAAHRPTGRRP